MALVFCIIMGDSLTEGAESMSMSVSRDRNVEGDAVREDTDSGVW